MQVDDVEYTNCLRQVLDHASEEYRTLPTAQVRPNVNQAIIEKLPERPKELETSLTHLLDLTAGLNKSASPRYFGFVTGGSTPAAQLADFLTTIHDQNTAVHLPLQSINTTIEHHALLMVLDLFQLPSTFTGRTLTTGATGSNILGLACGRNYVLEQLGVNYNEQGLTRPIKILCAGAHSSIRKAASIVGLGRGNCVELSSDLYGVTFDLKQLEDELNRGPAIVVLSFGEVNTGLFNRQVPQIRALCTKFKSWLHIDAAFAIFCALTPKLWPILHDLRVADSICLDGHKMLNVPYDCGIFLTRHLHVLKDVCSGGDAPYLETQESVIQSPLNISLENSRRFRALPVYATLTTYGRQGITEMAEGMLSFTRAMDRFMREYFEVLTPRPATSIGENIDSYETTNIILFTCRNIKHFVDSVNTQGTIYITGTTFNTRPAARIAVSNWRTGMNDELQLVTSALLDGLRDLSTP